MRYYYKSSDGKSYYNLKTPSNDESLIEITEQEFNEHSLPKELTESEIQQALANESKNQKIAEYKQKLQETDYLALKFFEGWLTEEEYAPIKAQRQAWRDEIGKLGG